MVVWRVGRVDLEPGRGLGGRLNDISGFTFGAWEFSPETTDRGRAGSSNQSRSNDKPLRVLEGLAWSLGGHAIGVSLSWCFTDRI